MAKAEMPLATLAKLYSQHLGVDVVVKNTFLELAKDPEPQRPARVNRGQSCPPRVGSSPVEPASKEQQPLRSGRQTRSKTTRGSGCAAKDESSTSPWVPVPSLDLPEMPEDSGAKDQTDRFSDAGCQQKDESSTSPWVPVPSLDLPEMPEMPEDSGAEDQTDRFPDAGCQRLRVGRIEALPAGWRWPQQAALAERRPAPEVARPAPATQAQPFNEPRLTSVGSRLHAEGSCKPCYFYLVGQCNKGQDCTHCHMQHDAPKWKRVRAPKFVRERVKKQAVEVAAFGASASAAGHEDMMDGLGGHATASHPPQPFQIAHDRCADSARAASAIPALAGQPRVIVSL